MLALPYNPFAEHLAPQICPLPGCPGHLLREHLPDGSISLMCSDPLCELETYLKPASDPPGYQVIQRYQPTPASDPQAPRLCEVAACTDHARAGGFCDKHNSRFRRWPHRLMSREKFVNQGGPLPPSKRQKVRA